MTRTRSLFAAAVLALAVAAGVAGCGRTTRVRASRSAGGPRRDASTTTSRSPAASSTSVRRRLRRRPGQLHAQPQRAVPGRRGRPDGAAAARSDGLRHAARARARASTSRAASSSPRTTRSSSTAARPTRSAPTRSTQLKQSIEASSARPRTSTGGRRIAPASRRAASRRSRPRAATRRPATSTVSGWFTNLTNDGTEDVEGTEAVHITGDVDVAQMLEDLAGIAESIPSAAAGRPGRRSSQASEAIPRRASTSTAARTTTSCASWTATSRSTRRRSRARRRCRSTSRRPRLLGRVQRRQRGADDRGARRRAADRGAARPVRRPRRARWPGGPRRRRAGPRRRRRPRPRRRWRRRRRRADGGASDAYFDCIEAPAATRRRSSA